MNREVRRIRDRLRDPDSMDPLRDKVRNHPAVSDQLRWSSNVCFVLNQQELLVRMVYCVMLGQEVDFGLVHALTMTQRNEVCLTCLLKWWFR